MMLKFWYGCILLLCLFRGILPGLKNLEHTVSSRNETNELNVPVGSLVELLSSIEANKHDTISLYANHQNKNVTLIAEWKSKKRTHMKEQYVGKIYMNDTGGIFMRSVDQADVGRYSFKYDMKISGITMMLNVSESTQEKQISKCLLDEEYMKILEGLQKTNPFTIIASIVVMIASTVYIIVHIKSWCSGQCRETPESMPRDLTLGAVEGDPSSVTLNWQPPQNPNGRITEYLVFYTNDSFHDDRKWFVEKVLGDRLSKTIRDLTWDTTYCFRVQARYKMEYGPKSSTVHYRTPKEEIVPSLALVGEQAADSTVVELHEETLPLSSAEQAEDSTAVKLHEETLPLSSTEQAEHSTAVKLQVQSHAPWPSRQDADSTPSKLSARIVPLSPRDEATDPTPTTAELLTEEQISQYLDSHPEFLIKYLHEKLKSANGTISF